MTVSIDISSPSAISNLDDLIAEIRDEIDDAGYSEASILRCIRRAEDRFNRELRTPDMETIALVTVNTEVFDLPADFLQLRAVYQEGSPDSPLMSMSPAGLLGLYAGGAGMPKGYAIEGQTMRVAPIGDTVIQINYYARIPSLSDSQASNWLLDRHADLYLAQALVYVYGKIRDDAAAVGWSNQADEILASIMREAVKNRWGAGPLVPLGLQQVRGARM